jgi:proton glutamate symport protein
MKFPKLSLTQWIFLGMGIGIIGGWLAPDTAILLQPLSTIFLRLIKTIIAPLIFATLVVGIAGHGNLKQVGRMAIKSIIYFEGVTTLALVIGLLAVNLFKPGTGIQLHANTPSADII